jgi:hypothetical protein
MIKMKYIGIQEDVKMIESLCPLFRQLFEKKDDMTYFSYNLKQFVIRHIGNIGYYVTEKDRFFRLQKSILLEDFIKIIQKEYTTIIIDETELSVDDIYVPLPKEILCE